MAVSLSEGSPMPSYLSESTLTSALLSESYRIQVKNTFIDDFGAGAGEEGPILKMQRSCSEPVLPPFTGRADEPDAKPGFPERQPEGAGGGGAPALDGPREPQSSAREEGPPGPLAAVQGRRCRGQKARMAQAQVMKAISGVEDLESITTVIVRNLPAGCKQVELVHALNGSGFEDMYNFCYMPCDLASGSSKGFAIVNFLAPAVTLHFKNTWRGTHSFPGHSDSRPLQVTAAHVQGYEANLAMALQNFRSVHSLVTFGPVCPDLGAESESESESD